ncbi:hypothetical protein [Pseudonocardia acaciae]|uniref:hypothetical protein n=1 Tax=Pseudonocardia acaciae TaxID=551276 RepID=UPI0012ED2E00|nr:hypothetical protein [Pseudonocardia acaciae]
MNKVDTKGSILLALEGGALFTIVAASGKIGTLAKGDGWRHLLVLGAIVEILLAMVSAGLAVFPRLGATREHRRSVLESIARLWSPSTLGA